MQPATSILLASVFSFAAGGGLMWARTQPNRANPANQGTQVTRREPQFENEEMKVWKSIIQPNQPLSLHRHEHGRALIALVGGKLSVVDKDGKTLDTYDWESGKAYWLSKDPPGQMHADVNRTGKAIEVIVVELKNDR